MRRINKLFKSVLVSLFRLIPDRMPLVILLGFLRGKIWIKGSGVGAYVVGNYEEEKQKELWRALASGGVLYDIGAHAGFFTLLGSVRTGADGSVYAFEPLPGNFKALNRNITLNRCRNVKLFPFGVSDRTGTVQFLPGPNSFTGRVGDGENAFAIRCVRLDDFIKEHGLRLPTVLKIDVEGAELDVLRGAEQTIKSARPVIFVAMHSPELRQAILASLHQRQYRVARLPVDGDEFVAYPEKG